jgi:hypothetical protein
MILLAAIFGQPAASSKPQGDHVRVGAEALDQRCLAV